MDATAKKQRGFALALPTKWQWLALGCILLCCVGLFCWAGYTFLPDANDLSRRQIINDDYSTVTEPLAAGDELRQSIHAEGRLYGVVLDITTYNRVARGIITVALEDAAGSVVTQTAADMTNLLDNTFHRFIFDEMVDAENGADYTIVVTTAPETDADVLGFYRSDGPAADFIEEGAEAAQYPLADFTLTQNGQTVNGTLALQYIIKYAGGFLGRAFSLMAAFATVLLLALYYFIFVQKAALHRVFILCALGLGFIFMFLIPPRTAPDEYGHITTAYHYTNNLLGIQRNPNHSILRVRPGDEMMLDNYDMDATDVFAYQALYEGLFQPAPKNPGGELVDIPADTVNVFPLLYTAPTLGVLLARLLGLGKVGLLLMGRLFNLIFYTAVVSRAVKHMPIAKGALFCAALLPSSLQLAASFSYDAYVIALSFYYIACCLKFALGKRPVTLVRVLWLGLIAVLLAPAKVVYLLLLPFVLVIPAAQYQTKRLCIGGRAGILAAALAVWMVFSLSGVAHTLGMTQMKAADVDATVETGGAEPAPEAAGPADGAGSALLAAASPALNLKPGAADAGAFAARPTLQNPTLQGIEYTLLENGDADTYYSVGYILGHIPQTIKLVLRTLWQQGPYWLDGLLGGLLGEPIAITLAPNRLFILGILAILLLSCVPNPEDTAILDVKKRLWCLGPALCVCMLFFAACLTWTPVNYTTIFGIQGRYALPVLPLFLLASRGGALKFTKSPRRVFSFALPALVVLCQLDVFTQIIAR